MTPHELNLFIQAYNVRMNAESDERMTLAYLNAFWHRAKKMPDLKKLLQKEKKKIKPQTPEQMLEEVKKLNAAFGGGTSG
ncbi:hypothetical protein [Paenibacillus sp. FSL L8-0708]|uniref:hypothetical protein n=1 Tax=Paenibacillus sp. FSL L8-0708 TaxID=2975311 RepID=UPI0030FBFB28